MSKIQHCGIGRHRVRNQPHVAATDLEQAEAEFRKAVQLYPRYAAAWMELGKMLEKKGLYAEARDAYSQSLAADPKFVYPYQQLYQINIFRHT